MPFEHSKCVVCSQTLTPPHYRASAIGKPTPAPPSSPTPFPVVPPIPSLSPLEEKRITKPPRPLCRPASWMTCTAFWTAPLAASAHRPMRTVLADTPRCPSRICLQIAVGHRQLSSAPPPPPTPVHPCRLIKKSAHTDGPAASHSCLTWVQRSPMQAEPHGLSRLRFATAPMITVCLLAYLSHYRKSPTIFAHLVHALLSFPIHSCAHDTR